MLPLPFDVSTLTHLQNWRALVTIFVIVSCIGAWNIWVRVVSTFSTSRSAEKTRAQLVGVKNSLWIAGSLVIIAIWSARITDFAISLAAIGGALLIVSKELILCLWGYVILNISRPYKIGQFIELPNFSGRVIDIDIFATTIAETGTNKQLTGRTVIFPNSFVLSTGIRNLSATGEFIVDIYKLVLPYDCDLVKAEACALAAAEAATRTFQQDADAHFKKIEAADYIDLPSARPKVLWECNDVKGQVMSIRFACPLESRVSVEQEIFRGFWANFKAVPFRLQ